MLVSPLVGRLGPKRGSKRYRKTLKEVIARLSSVGEGEGIPVRYLT